MINNLVNKEITLLLDVCFRIIKLVLNVKKINCFLISNKEVPEFHPISNNDIAIGGIW